MSCFGIFHSKMLVVVKKKREKKLKKIIQILSLFKLIQFEKNLNYEISNCPV